MSAIFIAARPRRVRDAASTINQSHGGGGGDVGRATPIVTDDKVAASGKGKKSKKKAESKKIVEVAEGDEEGEQSSSKKAKSKKIVEVAEGDEEGEQSSSKKATNKSSSTNKGRKKKKKKDVVQDEDEEKKDEEKIDEQAAEEAEGPAEADVVGGDKSSAARSSSSSSMIMDDAQNDVAVPIAIDDDDVDRSSHVPMDIIDDDDRKQTEWNDLRNDVRNDTTQVELFGDEDDSFGDEDDRDQQQDESTPAPRLKSKWTQSNAAASRGSGRSGNRAAASSSSLSYELIDNDDEDGRDQQQDESPPAPMRRLSAPLSTSSRAQSNAAASRGSGRSGSRAAASSSSLSYELIDNDDEDGRDQQQDESPPAPIRRVTFPTEDAEEANAAASSSRRRGGGSRSYGRGDRRSSRGQGNAADDDGDDDGDNDGDNDGDDDGDDEDKNQSNEDKQTKNDQEDQAERQRNEDEADAEIEYQAKLNGTFISDRDKLENELEAIAEMSTTLVAFKGVIKTVNAARVKSKFKPVKLSVARLAYEDMLHMILMRTGKFAPPNDIIFDVAKFVAMSDLAGDHKLDFNNFDVSQSIKSVADRMEADEDYQANVARLRTNRSKYSKYRRVVELQAEAIVAVAMATPFREDEAFSTADLDHRHSPFERVMLRSLSETNKTLQDAVAELHDDGSAAKSEEECETAESAIANASMAAAPSSSRSPVRIPPANVSKVLKQANIKPSDQILVGSMFQVFNRLLTMKITASSTYSVMLAKLCKQLQFVFAEARARSEPITLETDQPVSKSDVTSVNAYLRNQVIDSEQIKSMNRVIANTSQWNRAFNTRRRFNAFFDMYTRLVNDVSQGKVKGVQIGGQCAEKAAAVQKWMERFKIATIEQLQKLLLGKKIVSRTGWNTPEDLEIGIYRWMRFVMHSSDSVESLNKSKYKKNATYNPIPQPPPKKQLQPSVVQPNLPVLEKAIEAVLPMIKKKSGKKPSDSRPKESIKESTGDGGPGTAGRAVAGAAVDAAEEFDLTLTNFDDYQMATSLSVQQGALGKFQLPTSLLSKTLTSKYDSIFDPPLGALRVSWPSISESASASSNVAASSSLPVPIDSLHELSALMLMHHESPDINRCFQYADGFRIVSFLSPMFHSQMVSSQLNQWMTTTVVENVPRDNQLLNSLTISSDWCNYESDAVAHLRDQPDSVGHYIEYLDHERKQWKGDTAEFSLRTSTTMMVRNLVPSTVGHCIQLTSNFLKESFLEHDENALKLFRAILQDDELEKAQSAAEASKKAGAKSQLARVKALRDENSKVQNSLLAKNSNSKIQYTRDEMIARGRQIDTIITRALPAMGTAMLNVKPRPCMSTGFRHAAGYLESSVTIVHGEGKFDFVKARDAKKLYRAVALLSMEERRVKPTPNQVESINKMQAKYDAMATGHRDSMLNGVGHALIISRSYYLTDDILNEFHVPFSSVDLSAGETVLIEPGTLIQDLSTSQSGCITVESLSRTGMWPLRGGPQAIIEHKIHMAAYDWAVKANLLGLFYWGQPIIIEGKKIADVSRLNRGLERQYPYKQLMLLLRKYQSNNPPMRSELEDNSVFKTLRSHGDALCSLASCCIEAKGITVAKDKVLRLNDLILPSLQQQWAAWVNDWQLRLTKSVLDGQYVAHDAAADGAADAGGKSKKKAKTKTKDAASSSSKPSAASSSSKPSAAAASSKPAPRRGRSDPIRSESDEKKDEDDEMADAEEEPIAEKKSNKRKASTVIESTETNKQQKTSPTNEDEKKQEKPRMSTRGKKNTN